MEDKDEGRATDEEGSARGERSGRDWRDGSGKYVTGVLLEQMQLAITHKRVQDAPFLSLSPTPSDSLL